jgi:hypothetical protein
MDVELTAAKQAAGSAEIQSQNYQLQLSGSKQESASMAELRVDLQQSEAALALVTAEVNEWLRTGEACCGQELRARAEITDMAAVQHSSVNRAKQIHQETHEETDAGWVQHATHLCMF